jgi:DNA-binding MarR family transcriptional regulator
VTHDYTDRVLEEWYTVRPDLDVSPAAVVTRVLRLARYIEAELDDVVASHGLGRKGDFDTLAALRRTGAALGLSPTQLATAALITTGGMTSRLDRLEDAGYIERRPDPHDRRALLVCLTARGRGLVDGVIESMLDRQRRLLETLDADQGATLAQMLRSLLVHLGDD